jgi:Ca2+-transporting ATPase
MPDQQSVLWGLTPLHTVVPGRARFHVRGLKGCRSFQSELESALARRQSIRRVTASVWTGNILVHYDPGAALLSVIEEIERLLRQPRAEWRGTPHARRGAGEWHLMPTIQVAKLFGSSSLGLSSKVCQDRHKRCGPNLLPAIGSRSKTDIFLDQFHSLPVAMLMGAAALSIVTGGMADAIVILSVVLLNAGIGYATESQAEKTIRALSKPLDRPVPVIRDGQRNFISAASIVPGDLLDLRPGVVIGADARVVDAHGLTMNEAMLTGESAPVLKSAEALRRAGVALADRTNMVYGGATVTGGSGLAIVVATGADTEVGQVQALVGAANAPETPLQRQLASLGRQLTWLTGGACGMVLLIGLLRGYGLFHTLKNAVALGVAAIPEGFPALATTTLALGIERMRRGNVLVRRLEAVETLASVRVVCLDKTGTITLNRMTVVEISCAGRLYRRVGGTLVNDNGRPARFGETPQLNRLAEIIALCNEAIVAKNHDGSELTGSSTESALMELALDLGVDVADLRSRYPLVEINYRTEGRLFMMTIHKARDGRSLAAVKGSPDEVLALCRTVQCGREPEPMTKDIRRSIEEENARLASAGQRVLGVAFAHVSDSGAPRSTVPLGLTWLGLVGMTDPLRPGVPELLKVFHRAGISPVMITGDQRGTAAAIASSLDLGNGELRIVDSAELANHAIAPELSSVPHVFARVTPAQKLQIVRALQNMGLVVAMTGDGINDSPALKAADIGVAMGHSGSEAAREVAEIVLQDDNLTSLLPAIEQGRTTYTNIRKAIRFLVATNLSEILVVLGATAFNLGQPLAPPQLLWINLISDVFPALALGLDAPEPNVMSAPPRDPHENIIDWRDFGPLGREAALMSASALGAYSYGLWRYGPTSRARTICFASLVTAQLLHALTSRSRRYKAFSTALPRNHILEAVLVGSFVLQSAAMFFSPIRSLLRIAPISSGDALLALSAGIIPFIAIEALKGSEAEH